jgi:hypothetical protein
MVGACQTHDRHKERIMTPFENLKKRIARVVASDSIEDKSVLLEESKQTGFFDGVDEIQVMVLKTGLSDVWRTRLGLPPSTGLAKKCCNPRNPHNEPSECHANRSVS